VWNTCLRDDASSVAYWLLIVHKSLVRVWAVQYVGNKPLPRLCSQHLLCCCLNRLVVQEDLVSFTTITRTMPLMPRKERMVWNLTDEEFASTSPSLKDLTHQRLAFTWEDRKLYRCFLSVNGFSFSFAALSSSYPSYCATVELIHKMLLCSQACVS